MPDTKLRVGEIRPSEKEKKAPWAKMGNPEACYLEGEASRAALRTPDSGHYWWQAYFVATPKGLAKILREKSWRYLHAPQMIVLPRYDLEEIRRAVVSRIMADHEFFRDSEEPEEELV